MSLSEPLDVSAALKGAGLQVTAQRLAVHKAVSDHPHTMADEICDHVRSEIGAISRQAVYDTLNVMSEHGLIRRIQPAGLAARYEDRVDNHHHLVCRECGSLVDTDCAKGPGALPGCRGQPRLPDRRSRSHLLGFVPRLPIEGEILTHSENR